MASDDMSAVKRSRLAMEHLNSAGSLTAVSASQNRPILLTPESRLPIELITIILKLRFPNDYRSTRDMTELYRLKLVSKSWKQLIEHTPWFWAYVSADYPIIVIKDCLRLSRDHLLRIRISSTWDYFSLDDLFLDDPSWKADSLKDLTQKLQLLQPHAERWETLNYNIRERSSVDGQRIKDFLESPAPNLRSLVAVLPDTMPSGPPTFNLAGGEANRTTHLRLENALLPWSSQLLTGLETFKLSVASVVPVEGIMNIFINCPDLRSFELSFHSADPNIPILPLSVDPDPLYVLAGALEEVKLRFDDPGIASRILSQVSMPTCRSLHLVVKESRAMMNNVNWHAMSVALSQFSSKIGHAISEVGRAELYIWPDSPVEWNISSQEEAFEFSLGFTDLALSSFIECARDLALASASELEFEVRLGPISDRWIATQLGQWSEITKLRISPTHQSYYYPDDEPLFPAYLGQVQVNPVPGLSWPFPNLRELDISELECPLLKVFDMLNRRYLSSSDVQRMEDLHISVNVPSELDIRVRSTLEWEDSVIVPAIESHPCVKSLEYGSLED